MIWNWDLTIVEPEQSSARFSFEVRLFNAEASPTTLHRPYLVFSRKDGAREAASILRDSTSGAQLMELNLPAQGEVHLSVYAKFTGERVDKLSGFRQAAFVARFPDGTVFKRKIAGRGIFARFWWHPSPIKPLREDVR